MTLQNQMEMLYQQRNEQRKQQAKRDRSIIVKGVVITPKEFTQLQGKKILVG